MALHDEYEYSLSLTELRLMLNKTSRVTSFAPASAGFRVAVLAHYTLTGQKLMRRREYAEAAEFISPRVADEDVLRAWRAECPELRALWDESTSVTAWKGVTFGEAGGASGRRVVRIALEKRGLTGDVPAALGGLTALTWLNLKGNQLTSVPAELRGLTALTGLSLSRNRLTSVPAELGGLTALEDGPRREPADERAGGARGALRADLVVP